MSSIFGIEIEEDKLLKLNLVPDQNSYSLQRIHNEFSRTDVDGGDGKYRRDLVISASKTAVKWVLNAEAYDILSAFYDSFVEAPLPFKMDLVLEDAGRVECFCMFIPDTFKLTKISGRTFTVQATIEVRLPEYDIANDYALIYIREELGKGWKEWFEKLHIIVNYDYPVAMPYPPTPLP